MPTTLDLRICTPSGHVSAIHHLGTGSAHHDWLNFPWHGNAEDILVVYHPLDAEVCRATPDFARLWSVLEKLREIQAQRRAEAGVTVDELEARAQSIEALSTALEGMGEYLTRRGRRIQRRKALEDRKTVGWGCVMS